MDVASIVKNLVENGNFSDIQRALNDIGEMKKKEQLLQEQNICMWKNQKGSYVCWVPDETRKEKRRQVRRKTKDALIDAVYKELTCQTGVKTFEQLYLEFMEHKKKQVSTGTISRLNVDWKKYYRGTEFVKKDYTKITKIDVDDFFNNLLETNGSMKQKALSNMSGLMKQTFEYAVDAEYIQTSPFRLKVNRKLVIPERKKPNKDEVYTAEERDLLIAELERKYELNPSNTAPLAVILAFELGLRIGEMLGLKKSDIQDNTIHIQRQQVRIHDVSNIEAPRTSGYQVVEYTKSRKSDRSLPLSIKAQEILDRIIKVNEKQGWDDLDYLFLRNGEVMTPECIDTQIKQSCRNIGIPVRRLHKIRKTFASDLYKNDVPIAVIGDMMGHEDISTTIRHYIYSTSTEAETNEMILGVLNNREKATKDNQNIVPFTNSKKVGKPRVYKVSHL